ncbi:MAG: PstS family phosphate ABC transporter substrate-binding protein [Opitutales bacterium]
MRFLSRIFFSTALFLGAAILRAEEAPPLSPYQPPPNITPTIRIWGDRHVAALIEAWATAYRAAHPKTDFAVKLLGNGTAMPALYLGVADLAFFGRDLIVTDKDGFAHVMKYDPLRIELGTGSLATPGQAPALVLFVHRDNPLAHLTLAQVDAIFSSRRARGAPVAIRTWGDLGLTGEWARQPIHLYADDTESMTGLFFQHTALGDSRIMNWEHFTEFRDIRQPDGTWLDAAAQSLAALRHDRFGLALSNLRYLSPEVKPLALATGPGGPYFAPTEATLISRDYPLTRTLFACANQPPGQPLDPKVCAFLRFVLSPEGQRILARTGAYLALSPAQAQAQLRKLD